MRILFTPAARLQFLSALEYIRRDNPRAARSFRIKAERILRRLIRFPESGRRLPEFPELPFREVIVSPYRFIYQIRERIIWIVAVFHSAQMPNEQKLR
jgi:toxin ParE1/3/4